MKDATSNKATRQVTAHVSGGISRKWDTTFPDVAAYREKNGWAKAINSQTVFEASPIDTIGDGFMDRIKFISLTTLLSMKIQNLGNGLVPEAGILE